MARTDALSINIDANTADKLAEIQGFVIEAIQKGAVSEKMKNTEYSGDPTTGSVEIDRFKNAQVDDYGTARAAGAGKKILTPVRSPSISTKTKKSLRKSPRKTSNSTVLRPLWTSARKTKRSA
jgi:hypothetical protein